jgi:hypothetical protein
VAANLRTLAYAEKRVAIQALGVEARVWKADHEPHFVITAQIPLGGAAAGQTGQDCMSYEASQNSSS